VTAHLLKVNNGCTAPCLLWGII